MIFSNSTFSRMFYVGFIGLAASMGAGAMEPGTNSVYPLGIADFGPANLPPPGLYDLITESHVHLNGLMNNAGQPNPLIKNFSTNVDVVANRLIWVPDVSVLGGTVVSTMMIPFVYSRPSYTVGQKNVSGSKASLGDIAVNTGLGYNLGSSLKTVVGFAVYAPTGAYNAADVANTGANHWAIEPDILLSYRLAKFNADILAGYIVNSQNRATHYTSGNEAHFDYAAGWNFAGGWTAGVGGFVWRQVTDDSNSAGTVASNRAASNAIGPVVKYDSGKGWAVVLKYQQMFAVKNSPKGNVVWLKVAIPLSQSERRF